MQVLFILVSILMPGCKSLKFICTWAFQSRTISSSLALRSLPDSVHLACLQSFQVEFLFRASEEWEKEKAELQGLIETRRKEVKVICYYAS